MNKLLSFILFLTIFSGTLFSQTAIYKPFPTLYARWVVQKDGPYDPGYPGPSNATRSWTRYEANGDTIINNITYKKVFVANSTGYPTNPGGIPYGPGAFGFAYRNDIPNKKVYFYGNFFGQYKDTLWYDFDLNIGDTLKSTFSINAIDYDRTTVTYIDSVLLCGVYYKRFNFDCQYNGGFDDLGLIEGFGFEDNFIQTGYTHCPFEPVYIYHTDFSCSLSSVEEKGLIKSIQLFPNPAENHLQINSTLTSPLHYSITDCLGRIIKTGITEANINIDISGIESGLYLILLQDEQRHFFQGKFVKE